LRLISSPQGNVRTTAILAVAKANNIDLDIVEVATPPDTNYLLVNKLGKIPSFQGADGYILSECMAIAIYRMFHLSSAPRLAIAITL
jgi:elongation factor 1-gamma